MAPPDHLADPDADRRLEGLRAVTDVALAYLDLDDLLVQLLDRVLEALEAETAAVLLVDESGTALVARAARGIEEEVRQGVRVPMGAGFAGRIAAERRPIVLDRVDATTVSNPILWQSGIKAMLGVPLFSGPNVIGVLHVGSRGARTFHDDDAELLQVAAERIASALRLRLLEAERAAGEALQRSLLPSTPPQVGGLEFASRYVPAEHGGIGGDWYDVFSTEGGAVWVVTGDVAGHGLKAAVVMGRLRSALRSYALVNDDPGQVLAMTDRKVQHFEIGEMATVAVAVVRPPFHVMEIAIAGHLPPVLAPPDGRTSLVDVQAGPPLGAGVGDQRWPVARIELPLGAVAVFYTDGLVERRGEDIGLGLERVRGAVVADSPSEVCQVVMAELIGNRAADDDVALLAMRRVE